MRASSGCVNHRGCVSVCLRVGMFAGKAGFAQGCAGSAVQTVSQVRKGKLHSVDMWLRGRGGGPCFLLSYYDIPVESPGPHGKCDRHPNGLMVRAH